MTQRYKRIQRPRLFKLGNEEVEKDALQVQKDHMKQPYDAAVISFKEHILELQSDRHVHE